MSRKLLAAAVAAAGLTLSVQGAQAQELKIGFVTTMNHPLGKQMMQGFQLGLEHEGWKKDGDKLGGVPTKVIYGDDQFKPAVGRRVVDKLLKSDNVDIVAGIVWSNILMAVQRPVTRAKKILLITNAGAAPMFGRQCSPYFITTAWNNDQNPQATGQLMTEEGVKSVFLLAPNYQAGKDMMAGFSRTYKGGKILGRILFKLGAKDFQAELTRIRAAKPAAVFIFAPGPMGIAFIKQWAASGLGKTTKLYTVFTVDSVSLPIIGKEALGSYHTMYWGVDLPNAANKKFVKDFAAKYGSLPAHYAAQGYDAPRLLAAALRQNGGKFADKLALMKAMRTAKYDSIRGPYKYNVNGAPIQSFYKREVIIGLSGKPEIVTRGVVVKDSIDAYVRQCPKRNQL